jgi:hypothetical protein
MHSLPGSMRSQRASETRATSRQPLDKQSRRNRDAIRIRVMSHQWRSASVPLVSGLSAHAASERSAGRLSAAPR